MGNLILKNKWVEKGIMQVKDVSDSEGELIERTHLNDMYNLYCIVCFIDCTGMYNIQCNFLVYEHLAFSIGNKIRKFSHNRKQVIGPDLPFILSMV